MATSGVRSVRDILDRRNNRQPPEQADLVLLRLTSKGLIETVARGQIRRE